MNLILRKPEFTLIQFSVRMTEANLRPSWPSYQLHMHSMLLYCFHKSGEVCTEFHNFATLGAIYIGDSSTRYIQCSRAREPTLQFLRFSAIFKKVYKWSTLSLWEDTTRTCTALLGSHMLSHDLSVPLWLHFVN